MFEAYRVPRGYMPFWHFGARMGIGTVRRFYARMRARGYSHVLDAGTGGGANVILGAWMGFRVTASDLARGALVALRDTAGRVRPPIRAGYAQSDSLALPFPDVLFDVVIASHIIEHLPEPRAFLCECIRVLRPGGVLRVSCPSRFHALRVGLWFGLRLDPDDHAVQGYDSADIAAMLPPGNRVTRVSYQGRAIESNVSDAQFLLARALGMSGNPAVSVERGAPPAWLFVLKEILTVPLLLVARCEDALLFFSKGSMITVEIERLRE
ncbi:MAG: class I SAM-dependent methyltransferase [Candidatus Hydrogenedentes bacterium]|nr:class I SAM-dependent methyltransferase [Candidatus Hydrogenedentota bacterium]